MGEKMKLKELFLKYREIILYLFFGGLTTVVNTVCYFVASWGLGLSAWLSSVVAWFFAVIFAFVTNKIFVFESRGKGKKETKKEAVLFFTARLASLGLIAGIMLVFVDLMGLNELLFFIIGQVVVLVFNYLASKLFIFKKG